MDISPSVNLLRSYRGDRVDYLLLVGEGVDNAFDAGATTIEISFHEGAISFRDDGVGIVRDRIASIFSIGDHGGMATTQLGRFGIGIKAQAINAGDLFEIVSTSSDGQVRASVNWANLLRGGGRAWTIPDPRWMPVMVGGKTGSVIVVSELRRAPNIQIEKIADDLALRFYPALAAGKRIILNGKQVECLRDPRMNDIIDCRLSLSDGRNAHVRGGILAEQTKLNKVHVGYGHRVIMPASPLGCGKYSGLTKMFARVQIDGPWHLARFKNDLP